MGNHSKLIVKNKINTKIICGRKICAKNKQTEFLKKMKVAAH